MLGFAVVDRQDGSDVTAVWLTTRIEPVRAGHTNAACIDDADPNRDTKLHSLLADRVVVLSHRSRAPRALASPLPIEAISGLIDETLERQQRIDEAIAAHSRGKSLVKPVFPNPPPAPDLATIPDAAHRALATANYIARAWTAWLATEEQRRRRISTRGLERARGS